MSDWTLRVASTPAELQRAFAVRSIVFIGEQRCPYVEEFDGLDASCIHVLGEEAGEPIAAARLRPVEGAAKLERIAVLARARGRGIGHALVDSLVELARARGFHRFKMHAQVHLVDFYRRHGFEPQGEIFQEAGIDHLVMVREDTMPVPVAGGAAPGGGVSPAVGIAPPDWGAPFAASRVALETPAATPVPAVEIGGFWIRLLATVIDGVLGSMITLPIMYAWYGDFFHEEWIAGKLDFVVNWLLPPIVTVLFWRWRGATPGKMLLRLRIVDARTGARPHFAQLVGRYLGYLVATIPCGLGLLWVAWDPRKQGWHDKLAGTLVVRRGWRESWTWFANGHTTDSASSPSAAPRPEEDWMPF